MPIVGKLALPSHQAVEARCYKYDKILATYKDKTTAKYMLHEEAFKLVKKYDHALDPRSVREFCAFVGYTEKEFWKIIDSFYNRDLFEKDKLGRWVLKLSSEQK